MARIASILFFASILIAAGSYAVSAATPAADDVASKQKKLEDVKKRLSEEKKVVKSIVKKESTVLGELDRINKGISSKREELKKVEASIERIRKDINVTTGNISRHETDKKVMAGRLKQRLRAMYVMRKGEYMNALFSSDSSEDLGRRHKYLAIIMDSDTRLINGYEKSIRNLGRERERLGALNADLDDTKSHIVVSKTEAEHLQKQKSALLSDVKLEKDRRLKTVKELTQAANELTDLIDKLRAHDDSTVEYSGFAAAKGALRMPVDGPVVSRFGKVKDPRFQTVTFNNGIIIESPAGTPVKNVFDGKVIYDGWLKGYGQVMIIDHKGGYYTLFAHLSKVLKGKGETVRRGEDVALVGDSGTSSTPGLYFEVRQKGAPKDPLAWLAVR